jgi:acyl-CoA reductase-like NAD-dependent aldehyde dehydrogenase
VRITGEVLPLDISPRARDYTGDVEARADRRVLVHLAVQLPAATWPAHKVAPAIAAGCPFVLKPASLTPVGALIIGEVLAEAGLPRGAFSILPARRDGADLFTTDERLKLLSFTGSPAVGWDLKARAGKKKVVLELGGNAAVIVDADADLADAVARIVFGAFYQSGQSCIGVQRVLVHADVYASCASGSSRRRARCRWATRRTRRRSSVPMISEKEAERLHGLDRGRARRGRARALRRGAARRDARGDAARGRPAQARRRVPGGVRPGRRCCRSSAISTPRSTR